MLGVVALAALVAYLTGWSANFQAPRTAWDTLSGGDFLQFYVAGQLVQAGQADRLYDFNHVRGFQHDKAVIPYDWDPNEFGLYVYPPFFVWFCLPFSLLPFHVGAVAWLVVMAGCLAAAAGIMAWSTPGARPAFGWVLLGCLIFRPAVMSLYTCQNSTLSLLILATCFALLRGGRPMFAGAVFALLAFKPQLTLVIAVGMLGMRQWRFLAGAAIGGLVLFGASLALSPAATLDYIRLAPTMSKWIDMPGMPLERMSCWYGFWRLALAGHPLIYAQAATAIMSLVTLLPLAQILRRHAQQDQAGLAFRFAALTVATVVLSPHLLSYDLTLLLLPLMVLATVPTAAKERVTTILPEAAEARCARSHPDLLFRPRLQVLAAAVFVGAGVSEALAAVTGLQLIVPLLVVTLALLAKSIGPGTRSAAALNQGRGFGPARMVRAN